MNDTWLKIITKAWNEPAFKARLIDPKQTNAVLEEYLIDIPPGVTYVVKEDEVQGTRYLVLPPTPTDGDPSLTIDNFGRDAQSGDPGF